MRTCDHGKFIFALLCLKAKILSLYYVTYYSSVFELKMVNVENIRYAGKILAFRRESANLQKRAK